MIFQNPILAGFYPDPSICRVNDDYYLVTSTFSYFPGVPIFHSKDLVNWRQIGHVLDRKSQLDIGPVGHSQGIYAPTIRYDNGVFYMITTNVGGGGNFIVTATDPAGDWSDPYWLPDAPGIDPSLFFDDDGRAYYCGTRSVENPRWSGDNDIYLQELDLTTMKLIGEKHSLWRGAIVDVVWPEAPHIYKKDGFYYLMIAESGTSYHHAITIARSEQITGPYKGNRSNPILTHRNLGRSHPIVNVGHGDLVHTQNNEWWMVTLASRPYGGYYRNLGRETFMVPVIWEDGWPIVCPGTGKVEFSYSKPNLPAHRWPAEPACDHFDEPELGLKWNCIRSMAEFSLTERPGHLRIPLKPIELRQLATPGLIARRQQHMNFVATTVMEFSPANSSECAGFVLLQSNDFYYRFVRNMVDNSQRIQLISCVKGAETLLFDAECNDEKLYLKVEAHGQDYRFYYGTSLNNMHTARENVDGRILSTDRAGGFVGAYLGMYASSNGQESSNYADFDWFEYKSL